jgi:hypothetical protein
MLEIEKMDKNLLAEKPNAKATVATAKDFRNVK